MARARHTVSSFPLSRLATIDLGRVSRTQHQVTALIEVDVTDALRKVRELRAQGVETSFFAWLVKTASVVIAEDPTVHARRLGKNSLVTFDDVDVSAIVEKEFEGKSVPLPVVLRACNKKSVEAIHAELRAAKGQSVRNEGDFVLSEHRMRRILMRIYFALPSWLRAFVLRSLTADPFRSKEQMGTVVITSLGSLARLPGWFIPRTLHPLCLAVGAVVKKPWVVDERVDVRDILHLTVLFDHDVVDGAPAARFLQRLAEQLQA